MKKGLIFFVISSTLTLFFLIPVTTHANVYEASTLHNAVSRSDTVQGLFYQRWETIIEESLYLDLYSKINWLSGFQVNSYNRGTGTSEATEMTLVRTYGSITITYPILTMNYFDQISKRFDYEKKEQSIAEEEEGTGISKYWDENALLIGITTTGFHYGLTRKTEVDRGDAGSETVTDYKYTQFFDDIYAISILYVPYVYIHGGYIVNNQIEPDDDGTIDYGDSSNRTTRYFFSSNILSFLNTNATVAEREVEVLAFSLNINQTIMPFYQINPLIPEVTIGYKQINLYNDEGFDPVWVSSFYIPNLNTIKDGTMTDSNKDEAQLQLYTLLLTKNFGNIVIPRFYMEMQRTDKTLIDKRTMEKIDIDPIKDMRIDIGINFFGFFDFKYQTLIISGGWSRFWDPAIAVHRESGTGYSVDGWIFKIEYNMPFGGAHFMVNKNYSKELRKLIEATDKLAIEGSLFLRI